jgi:hypothetical protein
MDVMKCGLLMDERVVDAIMDEIYGWTRIAF